MKVLLINGSPHKNGCTARALVEIQNTLSEYGIESEIFHIGTEPISGCRGCKACINLGKCVIDDIVNDEISPPHGRDAFMSWYFARCPLESISSRDIQNAEEIWRFVSGEPDDLSERAEREQLWRRTRNALDRRKGNAVVAVTIRC